MPTLRPQDDFMNGYMNGNFDRKHSYPSVICCPEDLF